MLFWIERNSCVFYFSEKKIEWKDEKRRDKTTKNTVERKIAKPNKYLTFELIPKLIAEGESAISDMYKYTITNIWPTFSLPFRHQTHPIFPNSLNKKVRKKKELKLMTVYIFSILWIENFPVVIKLYFLFFI
jgi:hypothetical protein